MTSCTTKQAFPGVLIGSYNNTTLDLTAPGQTATFTVTWKATANLTGPNVEFEHNLTVVLDWNQNNPALAGGNLSQNVTATFAPTLLVLTSATLLANGAANTTVELGQVLGVKVVVTPVANSTIGSLSAQLYYNDTVVLASYENTSTDLVGSGQPLTFTLSWKATENVTGLHAWFLHNLTVELAWNNATNDLWLGSDNLAQNVSVRFAPSQIRFASISLPPSTIDLSQRSFTAGMLAYNGSQTAVITLTATPVGGGQAVEIAAGVGLSGTNFSIAWFALQPLLVPERPTRSRRPPPTTAARRTTRISRRSRSRRPRARPRTSSFRRSSAYRSGSGSRSPPRRPLRSCSSSSSFGARRPASSWSAASAAT